MTVPDGKPAPRPATTAPSPSGPSNLMLRVLSALVMVPLALGITWWGGWPFVLLWLAAGAIVLWEWAALASRGSPLATWPWSARQSLWIAGGLAYAAALVAAALVLRADAAAGFAAILFLFAVVWLTDIAAYFTGRAIGGPKLMPRVSPKKTWSGALGGTAAGVAGGLAVAAGFGFGGLFAVALVALALSVVSQAGDLLESAFKRRFDAKDSGGLIPGHGGLMDRLDGFAAAAMAGALIGVTRGGLEAPGRGLLAW